MIGNKLHKRKYNRTGAHSMTQTTLKKEWFWGVSLGSKLKYERNEKMNLQAEEIAKTWVEACLAYLRSIREIEWLEVRVTRGQRVKAGMIGGEATHLDRGQIL